MNRPLLAARCSLHWWIARRAKVFLIRVHSLQKQRKGRRRGSGGRLCSLSRKKRGECGRATIWRGLFILLETDEGEPISRRGEARGGFDPSCHRQANTVSGISRKGHGSHDDFRERC